jgi:vancomycin permeability regulator SanA
MKSGIIIKIAIVLLVVLVTPIVLMQVRYRFFNTPSDHKVAIVFGAGLVNGRPSKVLASRLDEAVVLYNLRKVNKILVTGDNRQESYNEPKAMTEYLVNLGVNPDNIVQDYAGRRTVDSCYRAKNVFNVSSAYIISQPFHLPRALWLCEGYGIKSTTIGAANLPFSGTVYQYIREIPSSFIAFWQSFYYTSSLPGDGSEAILTE